jgi:hypothetical protein
MGIAYASLFFFYTRFSQNKKNTKMNAGISGTCIRGRKTDVRVRCVKILLHQFDHFIPRTYIHTYWLLDHV